MINGKEHGNCSSIGASYGIVNDLGRNNGKSNGKDDNSVSIRDYEGLAGVSQFQ